MHFHGHPPVLEPSTRIWGGTEDALLLHILGWSGNSDLLPTAKAMDSMQNRPIPLDQTIVELAEPLQIISCARLPIESKLNAASARVWMDPKDLERILILLAQIARHTLREPDRIRILTWTSNSRVGPSQLWFRFEADAGSAPTTIRKAGAPDPSTKDPDPESVEIFRLRSRIEAIPAHLAELSRSSSCLGVTIVFDLANHPAGQEFGETAQ